MSNPRIGQILSRVADGRASDTSLPARLCAECLAVLPVSGVALALMTDDGPSGVVLAATDEHARQLEELQFALDEGPCVEASRSDHPVLHPELTTTGSVRWPRYGAAALDASVHAIFAFPLRVGAVRIGVLDLYRDTPGPLNSPDLADALAFADAATVLLLYLQDHPGPDGEPTALTGPIDSRAEVHQATGMITVQLGVSLTDALLRLRAHAYDSGQTVTDVAADVVGRRQHHSGSAITHPARQRAVEFMVSREQRIATTFVELADTLVADFRRHRLPAHPGHPQCRTLGRLRRRDHARRPPRRTAGDGLLHRGSPPAGALRTAEQRRPLSGLLPQRSARGPQRPAAVHAAWPAFTPQLRQHGFHSAQALPMRLRSETIGALNLFRTEPGRLSDADLGIGPTSHPGHDHHDGNRSIRPLLPAYGHRASWRLNRPRSSRLIRSHGR